MGSIDSTFCYSILIWYPLLASLSLLHIAIQNIQVLMHIATGRGGLCCKSQLC
jgi:hypothetical protein